ncbi:MAG: SYNERG-CTERM sorting domain-containing protein [Fretibacterium sp.]|nr:SYNERG-CTERM sorting domain-containing protein [Fretibacterium sp.]
MWKNLGVRKRWLGILARVRACALCVGIAGFLLLLLHAAPSEAVLVNGKELDKIDDIVKETTGERKLVKESFLKVMKADDLNFRFYPTKGNDKGTPKEKPRVDLGFPGNLSGNRSNWYTNTGIHPAVGKKRGPDGSSVVLVPASSKMGIFYSLNTVKPTEKGELVAHDERGERIYATTSGREYITDSASGLFPNGKEGNEIFVIAYLTAEGDPWSNKRPGARQNYGLHLAFVEPWRSDPLHGTPIRTLRAGENAFYPSVRVVAGDFDNDGQSNEFAVIHTFGGGYRLEIFRASGASGKRPDYENMKPIYSENIGLRWSKYHEGCDIVAGDFNGDGKTELAAVYSVGKEKDKNWYYYPAVKTYSWNGKGFSGIETTMINDEQMLGGTKGQSSLYGIRAEAGDLDGDGKDELVLLYMWSKTSGYIQVAVWGTDRNLKPAQKFWQKTGLALAAKGKDEEIRGECSFLHRSVSLALVPLERETTEQGGSRRKVFISVSQGDDTKKQEATLGSSTPYFAGDRTWYMSSVFSGGKLTGFSEYAKKYAEGGAGRATALLPGDFYNESILLGEPTHLKFEAERCYVAEIQTPPYHVDYVQLPFEVNKVMPDKKSVQNLSWTGSSVKYVKSETLGSGKDISFGMTNAAEWGVKAGPNVKRYKLAKGKLPGDYNGMVKKAQDNVSTNLDKVSTTIETSTNGSDNLILYTAHRHVWRYPILSETPPELESPLGEGEELNGDKFITFSLCDSPELVHGNGGPSAQFDDYQPIHEEGNLFSYPTKVVNTPHHKELQKELSGVHRSKTGSYSKLTLAFSKLSTDKKTNTSVSKKQWNGTIPPTLGLPSIIKTGLWGTTEYSNELTNTETFTKTYELDEKFTVELQEPKLGFSPGYIAHFIEAKCYADVAGVMKVAFGVDLYDPQQNAWVWRTKRDKDNLYANKPDPALVLPARYDRSIEYTPVPLMVWGANKDWISATQLRGIRFWDKDDLRWTKAGLVRGRGYEIQIPLYNASFVDAGDVAVEMRLRKEHEKTDLRTLDKTTVRLRGWTQGTEDNKATATFVWEIPSDFAPGNYDLHFVVDPKNSIDELHEEWDYEKDPGGNNVGRYPIAVLAEEPKPVMRAASAGLSVRSFRAAATEGDFRMTFHPLREDDERSNLTLQDFRTELKNQTEDFRAYATLRYSGTETLTNMYVTVTRVRDDGSRSRVASRIVPALFPNTERSFSFLLSPARMREGRLEVNLTGDNVNLQWPQKADPTNPPAPGGDTSGGGCNAGIGAIALFALLGAVALRRKKES